MPDGDQVTYHYDVDGNLATVTDATTTYATFTAYDELGQVGSLALGDTSTMSYFHDAKTRRLSRITAAKGTALLDLSYIYDAVGNVTSINDAVSANGTQHFRYDELDRLVWTQSASYAPNNSLPPAGLSYTYDPVRVHELNSTSDGRSYNYDGNGNTHTDGQRTMTWDANNQVLSVAMGGATTSFTYDGAGARVTKVSGGNTLAYVGKLFECLNPSGGATPACTRWTRYVFAGFDAHRPGRFQRRADVLRRRSAREHAGALGSAGRDRELPALRPGDFRQHQRQLQVYRPRVGRRDRALQLQRPALRPPARPFHQCRHGGPWPQPASAQPLRLRASTIHSATSIPPVTRIRRADLQ